MFTHRRQTTVCFAYHHYYYCCYNERINNLCHHRLRSTVTPVLTATDFVNGKRQYWPSQNRHPSTDHQKMVQMISLAALPNLVQIRSRKRLGEWLKYKDYLFIYLYLSFGNSLTGQTCRRILTLAGSTDADLRKDVPFGAWIGVFKPNRQNIESFILTKLLHWFQPSFATIETTK